MKIDFILCLICLACLGRLAYPCGLYTGYMDFVFPPEFCYLAFGCVHVPHQICMRPMNTFWLLASMLEISSLVSCSIFISPFRYVLL